MTFVGGAASWWRRVGCSEGAIELVYPRGSTLNVQEPAVPIITSGFISYPLNRPIAAVSVNKVCCCSPLACPCIIPASTPASCPPRHVHDAAVSRALL
jgi:hypothetical protein